MSYHRCAWLAANLYAETSSDLDIARMKNERQARELEHLGPLETGFLLSPPMSVAEAPLTTWTCIVCGEVHPIDHAGQFSPDGMACCGCEGKAQWNS